MPIVSLPDKKHFPNIPIWNSAMHPKRIMLIPGGSRGRFTALKKTFPCSEMVCFQKQQIGRREELSSFRVGISLQLVRSEPHGSHQSHFASRWCPSLSCLSCRSQNAMPWSLFCIVEHVILNTRHWGWECIPGCREHTGLQHPLPFIIVVGHKSMGNIRGPRLVNHVQPNVYQYACIFLIMVRQEDNYFPNGRSRHRNSLELWGSDNDCNATLWIKFL